MRRQPADLVKSISPEAREAFDLLDGELDASGAAAEHDVKTIYISYMVGEDMVAAVYPRSQEIEVALALPEDHPSPLLRDATHLTWRTLPVSVVLVDAAEACMAMTLINEAVERVTSGIHDVHRDNAHFIARRSQRSMR